MLQAAGGMSVLVLEETPWHLQQSTVCATCFYLYYIICSWYLRTGRLGKPKRSSVQWTIVPITAVDLGDTMNIHVVFLRLPVQIHLTLGKESLVARWLAWSSNPDLPSWEDWSPGCCNFIRLLHLSIYYQSQARKYQELSPVDQLIA